jgi:hypothetical protein
MTREKERKQKLTMGEMKGDNGSKMVGRKEKRPSTQDNSSF